MITAFVLLTVAPDRVNDVADELATFPGVAEVHSVAGRWDLVAVLRVRDNDELADVVTRHVRAIRGIEGSETLIGFKVTSRHDLDRMFSIGMEEG